MTESMRDRVIAACAAQPGAAEDYPFGDQVAVFQVAGKMFALVELGSAAGSVSLKCDPDLAAGLRRRHAAITAGYHLNKRHWNTVTLDGSVPEDELLDLIDHSYELVVARLPRVQRAALGTPGAAELVPPARRPKTQEGGRPAGQREAVPAIA